MSLIEVPRLAADEVHLWTVDLAPASASEKRWAEILSDDERTRASRFHFARDRQFFVATRAILRTILGSYVASEPKTLVIGYSDNGKPFLSQNGSAIHVEFNVSHSGTVALLAFARGRAVGVDVEKIREDFDVESLARRFFSAHEQKQLAGVPPSQKVPAFFRCWTRKEAFIKATGIGLSFPLRDFDVSLKPADENALLATRPDSAQAARWSLRELPVGEGYLAALCVQGTGWRLRL